MKILRLFFILQILPLLAFANFVDFPRKAKEWFSTEAPVKTEGLKKFNICDFGAKSKTNTPQTEAIQSAIDAAAKNGGIVVVPQGEFLSGALFFKPNTHLYLAENAVLKGSDDISDFPILPTRIEGQSIAYFAALINANNCNNFSISGKGTIDGNGTRYWKSFWLRRKVNRKCTNIEELRPRLLYVSNSSNVFISGITLQNSPFWTSHYYKCKFVKISGLKILSPTKPVPAPSTDAIDIDACENVHIKNCYMSVNDDAIALKGGKGPYADKAIENGANKNILIENCTFGFCHSTLTCGSEAILCENIVMQNCTFDNPDRVLWLKMRPDTPQLYKNISLKNLKGTARHFLYVKPWTQFFDLKGRPDIPLSFAENISFENIEVECKTLFAVQKSEQYFIKNFEFKNVKAKASTYTTDKSLAESFKLENFDFEKTK